MSQVSNKILTRVYILFGAMALFACLILYRVVKITYFEKERWLSEVQDDRIYYKKITAARGNILSDNGEILATTQPEYRLAMDPSRIREEDYPNFEDSLTVLCNHLAGLFGTPTKGAREYRDEIRKAIREGDHHYYLSWKTVDYQDFKKIRNWPILNQGTMRGGLIVERYNNSRNYPFRSLGRITLGVLEGDSAARKGIEYSFDGFLKGVDGQVLVQRLPGGVEIPLENYGDDDTEDGADVVTTLNVEMQDVVEKILADSIQSNEAEFGVAILMEVKTGAIKAIANFPENQNRAIAQKIEPGSTFKLASAMALLDEGLVKLTDTVNTGTTGVKYFYETPMTDHGSYGKLSFEGVFAHSSNIGVSMLVQDHFGKRPERFIEKLKQFGLLDPKMAQIKGEPMPDVMSPKDADRWSGTTLPWMSIGYNTGLTPLQILAFYNAVANDGKLMQPYVVSEVRKNAKVLEKYNPTVLNKRIASAETIRDARQLLSAVVNYGTATGIKTKKYPIAGKTGTAKKVVNGEYQQRYQASFCGFFPADNPKYTLYVLVDEPKKGSYYGGSVAAPIFRSIADQIYAMDLTMMPAKVVEASAAGARPITRRVDQQTAERVYQHLNIHTPSQPETRWVRASQSDGKVEFSPMEVGRNVVPDVSGMSAKDAVALLGSLGMQVRLRGSGKVKSQSVEAGARLEPRAVISLTLE